MATWTNIGDTFLEPGKPVRSVDGLALRDNPIAIAEGASGAPRIVNAAVTNGTLGAEKFQTPSTTERDWVLSSTALSAVGAVGTYALLEKLSAGDVTQGATEPGSSLNYAAASGTQSVASPSGTWRLMGQADGGGVGAASTSVWLRIS